MEVCRRLKGYTAFPVDTGRKLNVHKTFRRRPGRLLNVLCTFNLRPVFTGFKKRAAFICRFPSSLYNLLEDTKQLMRFSEVSGH